MKAILAVLAALSLVACRKPEVVVAPPVTPVPIATPAPTPVAVATPAPPPATPVRHLAAEGVFYLISWVRVEKDDGITGMPPGTGVKIVRPGVYLTPAGEMPLSEKQITNDLDVARAARDSALSAKASAGQWQSAEEARAAAAEAIAKGQAANANDANLTGLDRTNLSRKLDLLRQRKAVLQGQISSFSQAVGAEHYGKATGKIEAFSSTGNLAGAQTELTLVNGQIKDAEAALRKLK